MPFTLPSTPTQAEDWKLFPERLQPRHTVEATFAMLCISIWDERNADDQFPFVRKRDHGIEFVDVPKPVEEVYFKWALARLRGDSDWAQISAITAAGLAVDAYAAERSEWVPK